MRRLFASLFTLALLGTSPAHAVMEDYPSVKLQGLDKSVGRTVTFEAKVGSTIQYGPLFIKIHACRKAPPIEKPESASFLQIWEVPPGAQKSEWVFSGWMFASSPALSAMDHPVYDVWVLDCLGKEEPNEEAAIAETKEEVADQTTLTPADPAAPVQAPVTEEQTEQEIPTDSEAEDQSPANPSPADQVAPVQTPDAMPIQQQEQAPDTQTPPSSAYPYDPDAAYVPNRPTDPTRDPVTAYDLMKQQGTNAAQPQPLTPQQQDPVQVEEEVPNY